MVDTEKEKARLNSELTKVQGEIDRLVKKLSNEEFVKKAPEKVVALEKEKLEKCRNLSIYSLYSYSFGSNFYKNIKKRHLK